MLNLPLLWISALFYVSLTCLLFLGGVGVVWVLARFGRGGTAFVAQSCRKRLVLGALLLPPLLALLPTVAGATLRHLHVQSPLPVNAVPHAVHGEQAAPLAHHAMACQQLFQRLFLLGGLGTAGDVGRFVSTAVGGAAWLLLFTGLILVVRLVRATLRLEAGLAPFLAPPSPRLAASLARVSRVLPFLSTRRFYECALPAAFSSVLGLLQTRCVLSARLVADAPDEEMDAIVAHEAGHLRGGDVYATFLVSVLQCAFFFLMPVRVLGRWWREAAEFASDDAAVRATQNPLALASAILRVSGASAIVPAQNLPAVALPFADKTACSPEKRVARLLDQAERAALPLCMETPFQVVGGWLATGVFAFVGMGLLLSSEATCVAHCALELVQRLL